MTIPCVVMVGTRPFFYKVPVTRQLWECVTMVITQYLPPTVVTRCSPPARRRASEDMEVPDYRRAALAALQYYDVFRNHLPRQRQAASEGCRCCANTTFDENKTELAGIQVSIRLERRITPGWRAIILCSWTSCPLYQQIARNVRCQKELITPLCKI